LAKGRVGGLDGEGLHVAQQGGPERRASGQGFLEGRCGNTLPDPANLHEGLVRRSVSAQHDRRARHALASEDADLDAATLRADRHHRSQACLQKVDVADWLPGRLQGASKFEGDGFEMDLYHACIVVGERREQTVGALREGMRLIHGF
jgi:hypothetical protein